MAVKCFSCGAVMKTDVNFCTKCGKPIGITQSLINRAVAKDQDACTELYQRTHDTLCFKIYQIIDDSQVTEDIAQAAYATAFHKLEQLKEPAAFPKWLYTIAKNEASDWKKKAGKEKEHRAFLKNNTDDTGDFREDEISQIPEYRTDFIPEEYTDRTVTAQLLLEMLGSLPEHQRKVIIMFYMDGMKLKDIAAELHTNESTIKSRKDAAEKNLARKIRALEKKGTKLYGLAPIPFLLMLLSSLEVNTVQAEAAEMPASLMASIQKGAAVSSAKAVTAKTAGNVAAPGTGANTSTTGTSYSAKAARKATREFRRKMAKRARKAAMKKIVTGVIVTGAAAGGTAAVYHVTSNGIPNEAIEFNGHHYLLYEEDEITWEEAEEACEELGGHLVTITSQEEQDFVIENFSSFAYFWIGGYRDDDNENTWMWVTGEEWEYEGWLDGEPNNSSNRVADENRIVFDDSGWNDLNNENTGESANYVCEWDK